MSYTILKPKEKKKEPRVCINVEIAFEDKILALKMASYLEELAERIDSLEGECYAWAKDLAELIRNE